MVNFVLKVSELRVTRGGTEVLHGVDFEVGEGRIVGLLGPSGCGKTTVMRAIVGTQITTSGSIEVLGRPAGDATLRSEIGYGPQAASVYNDLTVAENVRYFAAAIGAREDARRVMEQVELTPYRDRLTGTLSGGQRSRVNLAIALLGRPRLLILDEPTVGLDPVLREQLWRLFHELAGTGITLIVSSHVMEEAERCDELVLMRAGAVLTHETPAALKQRTGTDTLDRAFRQLIASEEAA